MPSLTITSLQALLLNVVRMADLEAARMTDRLGLPPLGSYLVPRFFNLASGDVLMILLLLPLFPLARFCLDAVLKRFAVAACVPVASKRSMTPKEEALTVKFSESVWKTLVYSFLVLLASVAVYRRPFLHDTMSFWTDCPSIPCFPAHKHNNLDSYSSLASSLASSSNKQQYTLDHAIRGLYNVEIAYYLFGLVQLVAWETRRKDHVIMMTHHIVTLILLGYSSMMGFTRVGSMVTLLHDVCDVPMEMAKLTRYVNEYRGWKRLDTLSECFFFVFFATWIASRLVYFPGWVIRSTWREAVPCLLRARGSRIDAVSIARHRIGFNLLLMSLFAMHVYWTTLIWRIVARWMLHGERNDVREKDE